MCCHVLPVHISPITKLSNYVSSLKITARTNLSLKPLRPGARQLLSFKLILTGSLSQQQKAGSHGALIGGFHFLNMGGFRKGMLENRESKECASRRKWCQPQNRWFPKPKLTRMGSAVRFVESLAIKHSCS